VTYATVDDMVARLGGRVQPADRELVQNALDEACAAIDTHCRQSFVKADTATARVYAPTSRAEARTDPFWTTTGLIIATDDNDDGVHETTWSSTVYELDQYGGDIAAMLDAPYDTIRALTRTFPTAGLRRRTLQVTAKWGWAAVPSNVVAATKIVAHDLWKRKDVAFGISTSGVAEFGGMRIGRDVLGQVESLLADFVRYDRSGIA
jgi:hypothetical protein